MRRLIKTERGQAIVETAFVMPIVILVLFGIMDAGRIFHAWIVVTNGAREGARVGATHRPESEIVARVDSAMGGISTYTVTVTNAQGSSGDPVEVTVATDVNLITPVMSAIFGNTVTLNNTATMRLE